MILINRLTSIADHFKPRFWNAGTSETQGQILFNYRKFWFSSITLRSLVSLVPIAILFMFTYVLENKAIRNENHLHTIRLTSNTRRALTYFFEERLDALKFIVQEEKFESLNNHESLSYILRNLQRGFGGIIDLGVINASGIQTNYAGPFDLKNKDYRNQKWFIGCARNGSYLSDVFLGYRNMPHMIIALKRATPKGSFYILRATLDIKKFVQILSSLELSEKSEAFLCNREGLLQTPSKYYGGLLNKIDWPVPEYSKHTQVLEAVDRSGNPVLIGYAYIENSPYILMLVKRNEVIMQGWYTLRKEINWIFGISVFVTLIVVLGISTFMVNKIYDADQTRLKAMERLEGSSRLISIGRLAAGVAHEINNPLAVIGENAGLIDDMFNLKKEYKDDHQLKELISAVLESVERCGEITRQLLEFARHFEPKIQPLQIGKIISSVLSFLGKEAAYRNIQIHIDIPDDFPVVDSDHGSLQQIFLNLINNAFQAMDKGGRLEIRAEKHAKGSVSISIADNGCGISEEDRQKIFEPFFTTKGLKGGTGLGLSITYGLVRKLRGEISVQSRVGTGTTFTVTLPIKHGGDVKDETLAG
ncbi:MAG: ATP-binding protein [Thermodesulfobacteriota bacterium]